MPFKEAEKMKYNKEIVKPDGRRLLRGGPRDMQTKQAVSQYESFISEQSTVIEVLRQEIKSLKDELSNRPTNRGNGEFTGEQVDEEINKAVSQTIKELNGKHEAEVKELKSRIASLYSENENLKKQMELNKKDSVSVEDLKKQIEALAKAVESGVPVKAQEDLDRPQFEEVFIDPAERDADKHLESHIKVSDVSINTKEEMGDKVNKLKNLLGKLPAKK
jgi:uncharacterized small protein (DUF1192 family)